MWAKGSISVSFLSLTLISSWDGIFSIYFHGLISDNRFNSKKSEVVFLVELIRKEEVVNAYLEVKVVLDDVTVEVVDVVLVTGVVVVCVVLVVEVVADVIVVVEVVVVVVVPVVVIVVVVKVVFSQSPSAGIPIDLK